ncbi:MAG: diaminopimelate epimerase [Planctomycetota bacterium]
MKFTKMHGTGNDYVFVDLSEETVPEPAKTAVAVSQRHFSVGADGLILIGPSDVADVSMRIFNADGSEAEMCGNGVRCVAKYAYDHGLCHNKEMVVETIAGLRKIGVEVMEGKVKGARVNMGEPGLLRKEIPMTGPAEERVVHESLNVDGERFNMTCVSMGNPHCVIILDELDAIDWRHIGPRIENHASFPERTNVHFVEVKGKEEARVATWERGSGETLACGTGASAVCVACHLEGETRRHLIAHLPGGDLDLEWSEDDNCVYMTGPAEEVYSGVWNE